ncbi:unnamed protein product [Echinostoma caproni]|uniref:Protein xylosyltransferase n=1 Tax=Echinostoma caproni TaxID=27848 RepID=A0A183AZT4_9TREM|nr:unnamed protein product [Echinostoma caproni]
MKQIDRFVRRMVISFWGVIEIHLSVWTMKFPAHIRIPSTRVNSSFNPIRLKLILKILVVLCGLLILFAYVSSTMREETTGAFKLPPFSGPLFKSDCTSLLQYANISYKFTVRPEEQEFPIAYSLLVYTDVDRVLRLLRAIYRPQNFYCIHIDRKSKAEFIEIMERLKQCPDLAHNVFFVDPSERLDVQWGQMSVLDADLTCARILFERAPGGWKYWINLTGQEFPLRTNWELVRALRLLNGANIVEAIYRRRNLGRCPPPDLLPFNVMFFVGYHKHLHCFYYGRFNKPEAYHVL